jgi:hypothetical protein
LSGQRTRNADKGLAVQQAVLALGEPPVAKVSVPISVTNSYSQEMAGAVLKFYCAVHTGHA